MSTMVEDLPVARETGVTAKARRWRFTAAEKLLVLREAGRSTKPGELGALLHCEWLYASHLSASRAASKGGGGGVPRAATCSWLSRVTSRRPGGVWGGTGSSAQRAAPGATWRQGAA